MSDYWMHIIDTGAPRSWIILLFLSAFVCSFLAVRKPVFEALILALVSAVIDCIAGFALWFISMPFFDPMW